jgi:ring-1,2-phenylacetyl-CoA epoxidase subunit PaaC
MDAARFEFLLRQGDNALVLGHRISEWCGHGPMLEEDIALANTALDLIGQTQLWLGLAAEAEGKGRTANDLAYLRDAMDFRNVLLVELPNGEDGRDYARTIMRQFLFDAFQVPWLAALSRSSDDQVAAIAAKSLKEAQYHLERSRETVIALGDGTKDSNARMQTALDQLWPYAGELMRDDAVDNAMSEAGVAPLPSSIQTTWRNSVTGALAEATLITPESDFSHSGGRDGKRHSEHLGHMLATMQVLQRSYPGQTW